MKRILTVLLLFVLFSLLTVSSYALDGETEEYISDSGVYEVFNSLDNETKESLSDLGIDEFSTEQIFKISPQKIITQIINTVSGKIVSPLKLFITLSIILVFESAAQSVTNEDNKSLSGIVFVLLLVTVSSTYAVNAFTLASSHLMTVGNFMISFVPVYAVLLSSSGSFTQALNFNTLLFTASQFIASFSENYLMPFGGILMSLSICSSLNPVISLEKAVNSVKKILTVTITFISTLFVGFLSLKGSVASSVDALTVKSIRTVSGSVIPFIGSTLADAYSSVLGSLKLINNCFGFLGIITLAAINFPVIIELLLYYFAFHFASVIGDMINSESSKILENIASIISIFNIIVIFTTVVFTVSTGIMLKAGGM